MIREHFPTQVQGRGEPAQPPSTGTRPSRDSVPRDLPEAARSHRAGDQADRSQPLARSGSGGALEFGPQGVRLHHHQRADVGNRLSPPRTAASTNSSAQTGETLNRLVLIHPARQRGRERQSRDPPAPPTETGSTPACTARSTVSTSATAWAGLDRQPARRRPAVDVLAPTAARCWPARTARCTSSTRTPAMSTPRCCSAAGTGSATTACGWRSPDHPDRPAPTAGCTACPCRR